jgi:hypothetical protein
MRSAGHPVAVDRERMRLGLATTQGCGGALALTPHAPEASAPAAPAAPVAWAVPAPLRLIS